ncbi:uncharacterized protein CDV56_100139 [Aspergillus thermomutatus]|uniref:Uncharacterized protein n=1 Tax=Aspergillus thermomutatus TaxID=41047 RepID=A0A397G1H1_ASPTH|nr:uncharacterized protein CDV56_100139 [Aspergillus thermomutatus]RHZ43146.1 hypothetical protein CDV56_100139 [Aspergillus thermomutatus]
MSPTYHSGSSFFNRPPTDAMGRPLTSSNFRPPSASWSVHSSEGPAEDTHAITAIEETSNYGKRKAVSPIQEGSGISQRPVPKMRSSLAFDRHPVLSTKPVEPIHRLIRTDPAPSENQIQHPPQPHNHLQTQQPQHVTDITQLTVNDMSDKAKNHSREGVPVGTFKGDHPDPLLCRLVYLTLDRFGTVRLHLTNLGIDGGTYGRQTLSSRSIGPIGLFLIRVSDSEQGLQYASKLSRPT